MRYIIILNSGTYKGQSRVTFDDFQEFKKFVNELIDNFCLDFTVRMEM